MRNPTYDTFLSHNSTDKPAVEALARVLIQAGFRVWLDKWNLIPGNPWQEEIEKALTECATCCVCIGPGELGVWQNEEMRAAIVRRVEERQGFRVIPVLLPGSSRPERGKLPVFLAQTTWVEFRQTIDEEDGLHRLTSAIRGVAPGPEPGQAVFQGVCPYRGLEVFDVVHAPFFFGREALTEWLLDELRPREGRLANRFLGIIGASGSGKSSLARAGLLAQLKRGILPGSAEWPLIILKPGGDPLASLAVKLARSPEGIAAIERQLRTDPGLLHKTARFMLREAPEDRRLVVLVDQFEEVFSLCRDPQLRRAFIENLSHAANEALGQTLVVLTMRADFYGRCAEHQALAAALADHQLLIGPMNETELQEAIERPSFQSGCELEPGLTDLLIRDVQGQSGGLPLLQYALSRLWEERSGNRLTLRGYQAIGRVKGALEQRADQIYEHLDGQQQSACRRIFLRLTEPGEDTEHTRRRARLDELGTDEATQTALQALIAGRLVTTGEGGEDLVEVSHEALIRGWPLLQSWIEADREALRIQHRLSAAVWEWVQHDRDPDYLYRGGRLRLAEEWTQGRRNDLSEDERAFVIASVELRESEIRRLEEQRRKELKQARDLANERASSAARLRAVLGIIIVALIVSVGIAGYALQQKQKAERQQELANDQRVRADEKSREAEREARNAMALQSEAEKQRDVAKAQEARATNRLAMYFISEADTAQANGQTDLALLLSVEALKATGLTAIQQRFREILFKPKIRGIPLVGHEESVETVAFDPNGGRLASGGRDGSVLIWDLNALETKPIVLRGHTSEVNALAFDPRAAGIGRLASAGQDGSVLIWDLNALETEPIVLRGHEGRVWSVAFDPWASGAGRVASGGSDHTVRLWDLNKPSAKANVLRGHRDRVTAVAFDPRETGVGRLFTAGDDRTLRIWDLDDPSSVPQVLRGHSDRISALAFDPQSEGAGLLASGDFSGYLWLWDLNEPETGNLKVEAHEGPVRGVSFDPRKGESWYARLASAGDDGSVRTWRWSHPSSLSEGQTLRGHEDTVWSVVFDPKGKVYGRLASAGQDGTVRLWNLNGTEVEPLVLLNHQRSGVYSHTFARRVTGEPIVVSADYQGVLRLSDPRDPFTTVVEIPGHDGAIKSVIFDHLAPKAGRLASGGEDGTVRLWNLNDPDSAPLVLRGHEGGVESMAFSASNTEADLLASGGHDGSVHIWDLRAPGAEPLVLRGHQGRVKSVSFDPGTAGAGRLASGGSDGTVCVWDLDAPESDPRKLSGELEWVDSVTFDPRGTGRLAFGGSDKRVRIWDLNASGDNPQVHRSPANEQGSDDQFLAYATPGPGDLRLVATSLDDRAVRVWDPDDLEAEPLVLDAPGLEVRSVTFEPSSGLLATASLDGTIAVWSLRINDLLAKACRATRRNLSATEWKRYFADQEPRLTCPNRPIHPDYLHEADELASEGEIEEAIAAFRNTLSLFKSDAFDPVKRVERYSALREIGKGDRHAYGGRLEAAEAHYRRATELDPTWRIDPVNRASDVAAWSKLSDGDEFARKGDVPAAIVAYAQAVALYPARLIEPLLRAHRLAAPVIFENSRKAIKAGKVEQALADYRLALESSPDIKSEPKIENEFCWSGSLWDRAADVMTHCDRAVAGDPENGEYIDSRGLARALTGDLAGAAEDFRAYVAWSLQNYVRDETIKRRRKWIKALESGQNPFDAAALEALRR